MESESENLIIVAINQMTRQSFLGEIISMAGKIGFEIKDVCCYALDPFGIVGSELKTTHGDIIINYQGNGSVSIDDSFSRRLRNREQLKTSSELSVFRHKIMAEVRSDKVPKKDYPIPNIFGKRVLLFGNFFDVQSFVSEALKKIFCLYRAKEVRVTTCPIWPSGCLVSPLNSPTLDGVLM